jgi:hypothetical protein
MFLLPDFCVYTVVKYTIMKKLLVVIMSFGLAMTASAQHHFRGGGGFRYSGPRVSIGIGAYAPFYPAYGYGYSPFYTYPRSYGYAYRPSKLTLKIEDIKNDYADKIWSAKNDTSLSRKERRKLVHQLKYERDQAIIEAKRNYYKY